MSLQRKSFSTLCLLAALVFAGCGNSQQSQPTAGSGSFSLKWETPSAPMSKSQKPSQAPTAPDVCLEYGITTLSATVYNGATQVASGGPWTCTDHQGTITTIPVGSGLTLQVTGFVGATTAWQGSKTGITITGGMDNPLGAVTMRYVGTWTMTTIPSTTGMGQYSSLALDMSGTPHISHYNSSSQVLSYSTASLSSWVTTTVDGSANTGQYSSIAMDSNSKVHISYYNATAGVLSYASNTSGAWVHSTVDVGATTGQYTSLALDANGRANISYYDATNGKLRHATYSAGTATLVTAETSTVNVGQFSSLALDSSGKVYISYYDSTNHRLRYATNVSGSWIANTVDSSASVGQYSSLVLDAGGKAYISYYDATNGDLKLATNATGTWIASTIDSTGNVGQYTSIALDSFGKVHISYYDVTNGDLKYASNSSGVWTTVTLDSTGTVGQYASIALDLANRPAISYYDATNNTLKLARVAAEVWHNYAVDSMGDVGYANSLAVDSSNKVHMSYHEFTSTNSGNLKYATNRSGTLVTSTVGTFGLTNLVQNVSAIATDPTGTVHIVYYADATRGYVYATNSGPGGTWINTNIPSVAGQYPNGSMAMALDSTGHVHVAYMTENTGCPYYTTNKTGVWSTPAQMTTTLWAGFGLSIVLDASDVVHAAWQEGSSSTTAIVYTNNGSGSWASPTTVETLYTGPGSACTSIAISPVDGSMHISYNTYSELRHATNASGAWVSTTIYNGSLEPHNSIAFDSSGTLYVSYIIVSLDDYISLTVYDGSVWRTYTVDSMANTPNNLDYIDMAIDSNNKVHISYHETSHLDLRYATNAP